MPGYAVTTRAGKVSFEAEHRKHAVLNSFAINAQITEHVHTEYVPKTFEVIAGDGLSGGGVLSSIDITLTVDTTVVRTSRTITAGAGLTGGGDLSANRTLDVGAGDGITVNADNVALTTPGSLSVSSTDTSTGNHTHAIKASSSPGVTTSLLKTDGVGGLTLELLEVEGTFSTARVGSSLIPASTDTYDLGSATLLWRKGWLSELESILFVENTITAVGGWFMVPHGQGTLTADAAAAATTIDFGQSMALDDFVIMRGNLQVEYLKVGSPVSGTTYNVTRNVDGSGANDWPAGQVFVILGNTGDGRIEFDAQTAGPRISVIEQGATYNAQTERVRIGDMAGWGSYTGYGIGIGDPTATHLAYNAAGLIIATAPSGTRVQIDGNGITGINGSTTQFLASAITGKLTAGGGAVTLDANGISIDDASAASEKLTFRRSDGTVIGSLVGYFDGVNTNTMKIEMKSDVTYGDRTKVEIISSGGLPGNKVGLHLKGTSGSAFAGDRAWLDIGGVTWRIGIDSVGSYQNYFEAPANARIKATDFIGTNGKFDGVVVGYTAATPTDDEIRLYSGTTLVGQLSADTTWFRINQDVAKNIYTPRGFAAGGGIVVGAAVAPTASQIRLYNGATLMGTISASDTTWFRINNDVDKDIYTPRAMVAADGFSTYSAALMGAGTILSHAGYYQRSGTTNYLTSPPVPIASSSPYPWYNLTWTSANNGTKTLTGVPTGVKYIIARLQCQPQAAGAGLAVGPDSTQQDAMIHYGGVASINQSQVVFIRTTSNTVYATVYGTVAGIHLIVLAYGF